MTEAQAAWLRKAGYVAFYTRWQLARGLVWLAIALAPAGPAKDLLLKYLAAYGEEILAALAAHEKGEA